MVGWQKRLGEYPTLSAKIFLLFSCSSQLNSYFLDMSQLTTFRKVRDKYINLANPPARTAVEVKRLFREGFLIEVEAWPSCPESSDAASKLLSVSGGRTAWT